MVSEADVIAPTESSGAAASLRIANYRSLFVVSLLTYLALQSQQIARGQLAYDLTGSNAGLGGVYLGFGVPMLLVAPWGGVAADRLPKRTMMLISICGFLVSSGWICIASALGVLEYWMLIGAAIFQGTGMAISNPTRTAFIGELVPRHLLGNAVALTQMQMNSTNIIGPGIAGALIAVKSIGPSGVYVVSTGLLVVAFAMAFRLPLIAPREREVPRSALGDFKDGARYARRHPLLRILIVTSFVMITAAYPYVTFLPAVANDMFDAGGGGLGLMSSLTAVAAFLVAFFIASRTRPNQAWRIQLVAGVTLGIGLLGIAVAPSFVVCLAALMVVGGSLSGYQAMNSTIALSVSDLEYHGRVQSLLFLSMSSFAVVALPLGVLADVVGLRTMFTGMGTVCFVTITLYALAQRRVRGGGVSFDLEMSPA